MRHPQPTSLLVAALAMLRHPCARNQAAARLLLKRAAEHAELTSAEREVCLSLANDLDIERPETAMIRTPRANAPSPFAKSEHDHRRLMWDPRLAFDPGITDSGTRRAFT